MRLGQQTVTVPLDYDEYGQDTIDIDVIVTSWSPLCWSYANAGDDGVLFADAIQNELLQFASTLVAA